MSELEIKHELPVPKESLAAAFGKVQSGDAEESLDARFENLRQAQIAAALTEMEKFSTVMSKKAKGWSGAQVQNATRAERGRWNAEVERMVFWAKTLYCYPPHAEQMAALPAPGPQRKVAASPKAQAVEPEIIYPRRRLRQTEG